MSGLLVVKLGGALLEPDHAAARSALWRDLAETSQRTPTVVVHGGGTAVDRTLARLGLTSQRRDGLRVTPPEHIDAVAAVLAGEVSVSVVAGLQQAGASAVGLTLASAGFATALANDGALGLVGRVVSEQISPPNPIAALLSAGCLPVVNSIGTSADGATLNVNADDAAEGVAQVLGAVRLVLLTDVRAVLDEQGEAIGSLANERIEQLIEAGTIAGGMAAKCRAAARAAARIGAPVTIASFAQPGALQSIARGEAVGTTIMPATSADLGATP